MILKSGKSKKLHYIKTRIMRDKYLYIILFIPLVYYFIFKYLPMYGIIIAFKDYSAIGGFFNSPWVGFKHFIDFLSYPYFYKLLRNTVLLNVYDIIFAFPAPIILALAFNEIYHTRFKKIAQSISYFPYFISTVVVCSTELAL